jgi:hypothetical protein
MWCSGRPEVRRNHVEEVGDARRVAQDAHVAVEEDGGDVARGDQVDQVVVRLGGLRGARRRSWLVASQLLVGDIELSAAAFQLGRRACSSSMVLCISSLYSISSPEASACSIVSRSCRRVRRSSSSSWRSSALVLRRRPARVGSAASSMSQKRTSIRPPSACWILEGQHLHIDRALAGFHWR